MTQTSNHAKLLRELWQAAVNLRGTVEPSDYKKYVLPIIFLRFLSIRYEERRNELKKRFANPDSDEYVEDPDLREEFLEDPDEYLRVNVFPVPKAARWENIRRNAQADDIKIRLDDALEAVEMAYPEKFRGLLPRIFAGSNLSRRNVTGLVNLFSKQIFAADHGGTDLIGKVYEYFIGRFADSEGKRAGAYFTPVSVVRTLVEMLRPEKGKVLDPCCGSGGMFVQSDRFTDSSGALSFYGQESIDFTYRLCQMNLFIHGLDADIELGDAYFNDKHRDLKADYLLANPPFNDGSKSDDGWGASRVPNDDPRLFVGGQRMPLSERNANTMWILHFLHHLNPSGRAGFVMATGELSNQDNARRTVRERLVEEGYVDCVVRLPGQLFANTGIPCSLWFLSRNRDGQGEERSRVDEILFIDARDFGSLIPGSRTQKELSDDEIERLATMYREFCLEERPEEVPGLCAVADKDEVRSHSYVLTPSRYVGLQRETFDDDEYEERLTDIGERLERQMEEASARADDVRRALEDIDAV